MHMLVTSDLYCLGYPSPTGLSLQLSLHLSYLLDHIGGHSEVACIEEDQSIYLHNLFTQYVRIVVFGKHFLFSLPSGRMRFGAWPELITTICSDRRLTAQLGSSISTIRPKKLDPV
jgi:hypothetical protein